MVGRPALNVRPPVAANVDLESVPAIAGVNQLLELGVESTLAPENRELMSQLKTGPGTDARILSDPQTAGGLLFGVPESRVSEILDFLAEQGCPDACRIGEVIQRPPDSPHWLFV